MKKFVIGILSTIGIIGLIFAVYELLKTRKNGLILEDLDDVADDTEKSELNPEEASINA